MIKILTGIAILFIFIFLILNYWDKSSKIQKKKLKISLITLSTVGFLLILYLLYN